MPTEEEKKELLKVIRKLARKKKEACQSKGMGINN